MKGLYSSGILFPFLLLCLCSETSASLFHQTGASERQKTMHIIPVVTTAALHHQHKAKHGGAQETWCDD